MDDDPFDELFERVNQLTPEEREANRERNLQKIAEGWAKYEALTLELEELQRFASPTPAQLRRIAELVQKLRGGAVALKHWEKAAEAGDPVAAAHLIARNTDVSDIDPVGDILRRALLAPLEHEWGSEQGLEELRHEINRDLTQYHEELMEIRKAKPEDFE